MVYTDTAQVRRITNIQIADISDADLTALIADATVQLNSDINTEEIRERVSWIDNTRRNDIDGINTVFYVRNWKDKYIADMNDDGEVTVDDIKVYLVDSSGVETQASVDSVDSAQGKFILSSAPDNSYEMYVTYGWCYSSPSPPSKHIALACAYLTASFGYRKINTGMSPQQVYGNTRFYRDMNAKDKWFKDYENEVAKINGSMGDYAEAEVF